MGGKRVAVTGAQGFLGEAVMKRLPGAIALNSDLLEDVGTIAFRLGSIEVETLVHLGSPSPGGIGKMAEQPLHIAEVAQVDLNVVQAAVRVGVERIVTVGSLCSYDPLDSVNGPYGVAKTMLHALLVAAHRATGLSYSFLELTNLYGPGDQSQHLIPMAIRKIQRAKLTGEPVIMWGTGLEERAFLYVDDAAYVISYMIPGQDCTTYRPGPWAVKTVARVVEDLATLLDYEGSIQYDAQQPATARTLPTCQVITGTPETTWRKGLEATVAAWQERDV